MKPNIIVICGPTGSGKTYLALELAKDFTCEIISADSMQIYRYMDIGTAKPAMDERKGILHHLLDVHAHLAGLLYRLRGAGRDSTCRLRRLTLACHHSKAARLTLRRDLLHRVLQHQGVVAASSRILYASGRRLCAGRRTGATGRCA